MIPSEFDPAPFRRVSVLRHLLKSAQSGEDADLDAGVDAATREVRTLTRRLVAERLPESPTPEEEDRVIRECWRRALRIVRRKAKRRAAGREWSE